MHQFPEENARSAKVQQNLADLFDLAESLYDYWLDQDKNRWRASVPVLSANLALTLDVQALRLFRSVVQDCQRAEAFTASVLTRTLFENLLAVLFLLKKDVRIIVEPIKGTAPGTTPVKFAAKPKSKATRRTAKHRLSRDLRANLFMAHYYFSLERRHIESLGKFPGMYHKAKQLQKTVDPTVAANYESEIGVEWSYILRNSDYYSGLKIRELAQVLDTSLLRWYDTAYHFQSCDGHAINTLQHLAVRPDESVQAQYASSDHDVNQSLRAAVGMFLTHMQILHQNLDFGTDASNALDSLIRKYCRLTRT
jgi:hypothetical protein